MVYTHIKLCMHEHFSLIINPFKYKCETFQIFICPFLTKFMNAKWNSWIMDLIESKWIIQFICKCNSLRDVKKFINPFKYKCEALSFYVCFNIY
jgi:hypothetical protein